ncbi:glycoside hydrolase [Microbispora rosea subsp. aerata]|nr:glycoside hydrolase family 43 protein [Microbispora rosea]GGO05856.1 glycoside hydrolase [Microbispora rosea subsp. aerata]GIH55241.1 glycoside hydrolase [Microbispora rosea subsp. aerata]GLJ82691.1 glycoside hydrolase [Microbispora rosea subsp. aerata]
MTLPLLLTAVLLAPPAAVIPTNFPDPDVIRVGSTYYAYSTSSSGHTVPVASAPSATGPWTIRGDALLTKPKWAGQGGFWAPDVSRRADGRYLMYFAAPIHDDFGPRCIGAALADTPLGPFHPLGDGPLVCDLREGGAIDPASFVDTDGKRYLLYKNDGNRDESNKPSIIWLQEVRPDGVTFTGPRRELIRNDRPDEHGVIEAPVLVKRPTQYVLFYAGGSYTGNSYFTGYATSPSLAGPFTKAAKPLMTTDTFAGQVQGPGGADVLGNHMFFHGWVGNTRWMYRTTLTWENDHPAVR